jgi:hypothetical protein
LSLECNLNLDTCFVSRVLAALAPERPEISVAELRRLGGSAGSLDEWLSIHEYLVKVLRKFQGDIGVLQRASGILRVGFGGCLARGRSLLPRRCIQARPSRHSESSSIP